MAMMAMPVIMGTPLVSEKERLRAVSGAEKNQVEKDAVVDEKGRKRFHGAFEGGFSAGYFNTVASEQGWTPSQYVRGQQPKRVEDYMDDEDDALMGARLGAREGFTDPLGLADKRNQAAAWGDSRHIPGPVPGELLAFRSTSSKGRTLLASMGPWPHARQAAVTSSLKIKDSARRGLGTKHTHASEQTDEAAEVWKRRRQAAAKATHRAADDDDDDSDGGGGERLAFEAVEASSSSSGEDHEGFASRILLKDSIGAAGAKAAQTWQDGTALPSGFTLARKHDPNQLMLAKKNAATPVPANASVTHDPGSAVPMSRPQSAEAVAATRKRDEAARAQVLKGLKDSLATRFDAPGQAPVVTATPVANPNVFVRTTATWEPVGLLRTRFGIVGAAAKTKDAAAPPAHPPPAAAPAPPPQMSLLAERKAVLGVVAVPLYESSDNEAEFGNGDEPDAASHDDAEAKERKRRKKEKKKAEKKASKKKKKKKKKLD